LASHCRRHLQASVYLRRVCGFRAPHSSSCYVDCRMDQTLRICTMETAPSFRLHRSSPWGLTLHLAGEEGCQRATDLCVYLRDLAPDACGSCRVCSPYGGVIKVMSLMSS